MRHFLGIDPGKSGAIAVLDDKGAIEQVYDMPVVGGQVSGVLLCDIIDSIAVDMDDDLLVDLTAVVEQVHSMPRQGVVSSFDFGKSYGIVVGVLAATRIRTEYVTPNRWKKALRLTADKEQARRRALDLWPDHAHLFARKKDADRAEAALLALWRIGQREMEPT